jgi:hypothetical protein
MRKKRRSRALRKKRWSKRIAWRLRHRLMQLWMLARKSIKQLMITSSSCPHTSLVSKS